MTWCEILKRQSRRGRLLVELVDGDGKPVVPERVRCLDGIEYRVVRKPEYGDYVELRPVGGAWGVVSQSLEILL